ncbi:MAG: UvrD-helicase domain-containing protein [Chloroflexaceae bacterium]|nr:UvrD-helicase domain-containing protein [Chloroflexaceae bacterium]
MTTELRWQKCERAWGIWLQQNGWNVLPAHTLTNNVDTTAAPMIQLADGTKVIAPDYVVNKNGVYVYWDVKYRSFREVSMYNGEEYFWISMHQFMDYFRLRQATGNQVNLVFYDNSQADEDKRWLTTDIYAIHQVGQQVQVYDNKHNRYISAMSVPMSILRADSGPAIDRTTQVSLSSTIDKDENRAISNRARLAELCNQLQLQTIPRYSLVWFGEKNLDNVLALMHFGIRIFLVTKSASQIAMADIQLRAFIEARFLEWSVDPSLDSHISGSAIDGVWTGEYATMLPTLFAQASQHPCEYGSGINDLQYNIVHAGINEDILVMAGAGTGKTETMAERLMFILTMHDAITQTQPLSLKEIALVTFTRDAAREMRSRIARTIVLRRRLSKYCVYPVEYWLNQLGKAQISTIHSFSKKILQRFGGLVGMAPDVLVSQRIVERRRFIKRHLSHDLANLYKKKPGIPAIHEWVEHIETLGTDLE